MQENMNLEELETKGVPLTSGRGWGQRSAAWAVCDPNPVTTLYFKVLRDLP